MPHSTRELYNEDYFVYRYSKIYYEPYSNCDPWHSKNYHLELKYLGLSGDEKILDMGCGLGRFVWALSQRNYNIIGFDFSLEAIEFAKSKYRGCKFLVADAINVPFRKGSFDAVFSSHFFEHITEEQAHLVLNNIPKLLKKNGKLVLVVPICENSLFNRVKFQVSKILKLEYSAKEDEEYHVRNYNLEVIRRELQKHGFRFVKWEPFSSMEWYRRILLLFKRLSIPSQLVQHVVIIQAIKGS